ncbi:phytoene desaturase family protein [Rhodopila sp.]|uniref:phytoene desaturase family protein n=1 Tax=Rhodopila sp. TaxID=2480087 RepID=UPI003D0D8900
MTSSVGVIGAGPGGLAAAMLLAQAGAKVTVHERLDRLGGRSGTIAADTPRGRFRFDMGPTFFLYPQVLAEVFAACGHRLEDQVELIRLDPQYHLVFEGGGELNATPDLGRLMQEVARLAPADAAALPRFMADNRAKLAAFKPVLENAFDKLRHYVRPDMLRSLPLLRPQRSVDSDLASYFSDPRVRLAFSFQSKYLGMSPFRCPSLFTILAFLEYEFGVFHPRGGTGAVISAMARVAESMGVHIQLDDPVDELLLEGRKAVGVRTRHGEQRYDAVVVNADFAQAMKTLVPDQARRRWTDRRIESKKFSCSTFMLYLGIEGRYDALSHHTIYLAKDYRRNIQEIEQGKAPPGDPSFYVQNACVTDPALAPPGHSTLYVLVPVAHRVGQGIDWTTERARFRAMILQRLERIGITGLEKRIRFEKVLTPTGWEHDMQIFRGATFNLSHSLSQMLYFRPHNRFEDLDRVYLVGGGTHPGSGLPVIFESARITARLLAEDLGLKADWRTDLPVPAREPEPVIAEAS